MLWVSLEGLCLRVKFLLPGKVETVVFQMLTPPSIDAVRTALKSLEDLNVIDKSQSWTEPLRFLLRKELTITDVVELRRIILLKVNPFLSVFLLWLACI
ncbi:unnamed protein product [Sphagnum jensenii]|uniref:Uncharacterized protein n=1 Tax=Sphagnum jensenii TaxID=128206 RepID=A0ABP1AA98_9BRYO